MPRPQLKPTEDQRRMVKAMAAMSIRQERIATAEYPVSEDLAKILS